MITQEILKQRLDYDPATGVFTRKLPLWLQGDIAGAKQILGDVHIYVNCKPYKAHRLAWLYMTGAFPEKHIDHINRDRTDNRWCNLREATNQQNSYNSSKRKQNTSGAKGVYWSKTSGKWKAQIKIDGKIKYLGVYPSVAEASKAYEDYAKTIQLNFYIGEK